MEIYVKQKPIYEITLTEEEAIAIRILVGSISEATLQDALTKNSYSMETETVYLISTKLFHTLNKVISEDKVLK